MTGLSEVRNRCSDRISFSATIRDPLWLIEEVGRSVTGLYGVRNRSDVRPTVIVSRAGRSHSNGVVGGPPVALYDRRMGQSQTGPTFKASLMVAGHCLHQALEFDGVAAEFTRAMAFPQDDDPGAAADDFLEFR